MRPGVLISVTFTVVAACSYGDPSLDGTRFKCDATHACPAGEMCLGDVCQRTAETHDGIGCGAAGTCSAGKQCCVDITNPPRCIPAADSCPGRGAFCDSRLDCNASSRCCSLGVEVSCDTPDCVEVVCKTNADCPSAAPNCCPNSFTDEPWGTCSFNAC